MPALVSHHHFAMQALKQAPPHIQAAVSSFPAAFRWGAQGPDIFYFYNAPLVAGKLPRLGGDMHRHKIFRAWEQMVRFAGQKNTALYVPYLCGFVCHYILDRTAHPYVDAIVSRRLAPTHPHMSPSALHKLCESEMDAAVITNFIQGDQHTFHASTLLPDDKYVHGEISRLLADVSWNVYGVSAPHRKIVRSMSGMIHAYTFLHDETGKRRDEVRGLEAAIRQPGEISSLIRPLSPLSEDCANLAHDPWGPEPAETCDFFALMDRALPTAAQLMGVLYECIRKGRPVPEYAFRQDYLGKTI